MTSRTKTHPLVQASRERLRELQQRESDQLALVVAAERALAVELDRAERVMARYHRVADLKQSIVDSAVLGLIDSSGIARASRLLGRAESDLVKLVKAQRREQTSVKEPPESAPSSS